jgi:hypothetical protein
VLADGSPQDTGYGIATPSPLSGQRVGRQDRSPDRFTSAAPRGMLLMAFLIAAPQVPSAIRANEAPDLGPIRSIGGFLFSGLCQSPKRPLVRPARMLLCGRSLDCTVLCFGGPAQLAEVCASSIEVILVRDGIDDKSASSLARTGH